MPFEEVWVSATDEEILLRLPYMVKRMNEVLRFHGEDYFVTNNEPASVLAALAELEKRRA